MQWVYFYTITGNLERFVKWHQQRIVNALWNQMQSFSRRQKPKSIIRLWDAEFMPLIALTPISNFTAWFTEKLAWLVYLHIRRVTIWTSKIRVLTACWAFSHMPCNPIFLCFRPGLIDFKIDIRIAMPSSDAIIYRWTPYLCKAGDLGLGWPL